LIGKSNARQCARGFTVHWDARHERRVSEHAAAGWQVLKPLHPAPRREQVDGRHERDSWIIPARPLEARRSSA